MRRTLFPIVLRRIASAILFAMASSPAPAQTDAVELYSDSFDVEPLDKRNGKTWPDGWVRVADPEHPSFNPALWNNIPGESRSGPGYLLLRTQGGGTALELDRPFRVAPGQAYALSVWIRTRGLRQNRAYAALRYFDRFNRFLREERTGTVEGTAAWSRVVLATETIPPEAALAQIRLALEGPDLAGEGWFDDLDFRSEYRISVQLPEHPGNIFESGEAVHFQYVVPVVDPGTYVLEDEVLDAFGRQIFTPRASRQEGMTGARLIYPRTYRISQPGYYESVLTLRTRLTAYRENPLDLRVFPPVSVPFLLPREEVVARRRIPFVLLHAWRSPEDVRRPFGFTVRPSTASVLPEHQDLTGHLQPGVAKILLWESAAERFGPPVPRERILSLARGLRSVGTDLVAVLEEPPIDVLRRVPSPERLTGMRDFFSVDPSIWREELEALVRDHRTYIAAYQIGGEGDRSFAAAGADDPVRARVRAAIRDQLLYSEVGFPRDLAAGGGAGAADATGDFTDLAIPPGVPADAASPVPSGPGWRHTLGLVPVDPDRRIPTTEAQIIDFVRRAVLARAQAKPWERVCVNPLVDSRRGLLTLEGYPTPAFVAFRTCNDLLAQTELVREPPGGDPVRLFDDPRVQSWIFRQTYPEGDRILIALWTDEPRPVSKSFYPGPGSEWVHPMGWGERIRSGVPLRIERMPHFITGVDDPFLKTQLSIQLIPGRVFLKGTPVEMALEFKNRFPRKIENVSLTLRPPVGSKWELSQDVFRVKELEPGATWRKTFTVRFPLDERSGFRPVAVSARLEAEREYVFEVTRQIEIGSLIRLILNFEPGDGVPPTLATTVFNDSREPVTVNLTYLLPGGRLPITRTVGPIPPGGKTPEPSKIRLPNDPSILGEPLRVVARQQAGTLYTIREVEIPR